jgi:hypothetical protein
MNDNHSSKELKTGYRPFNRTIRDDGTTLEPSEQNPLGTYHYNPASISDMETRYALAMVSRYVDIHSNSTAEVTLSEDMREETKQAIVAAWIEQEWEVGFHVKSPLKQTLLCTLRWARRCRWVYLTYEQEREGRHEQGTDTVERLADLSPYSGQSESAISLDPSRIVSQIEETSKKGFVLCQSEKARKDRSRLSKRKGCRTWKRIGTISNREASKRKQALTLESKCPTRLREALEG